MRADACGELWAVAVLMVIAGGSGSLGSSSDDGSRCGIHGIRGDVVAKVVVPLRLVVVMVAVVVALGVALVAV